MTFLATCCRSWVVHLGLLCTTNNTSLSPSTNLVIAELKRKKLVFGGLNFRPLLRLIGGASLGQEQLKLCLDRCKKRVSDIFGLYTSTLNKGWANICVYKLLGCPKSSFQRRNCYFILSQSDLLNIFNTDRIFFQRPEQWQVVICQLAIDNHNLLHWHSLYSPEFFSAV